MADRQPEDDTTSLLVVIPTYDERDNLGSIVGRVLDTLPEAHVLVVDDASPDGTGALADEMASADQRIRVLHRRGKDGLGAAYLAGFEWAMERGYARVVQMDADGSHPPEALPAMLDRLTDADLVIGSRYVPGGSVVNWPRHREVLSRGGNLYSRLALGVQVRDITAGYRLFRREVLAELALDQVDSQGYCFQIDMAWRTIKAGFRVREVPITFTERERGESKMSGSIVREALWRVTQWGLSSRLGLDPGHAPRDPKDPRNAVSA
ncbi:MAG TPA: polyprenol monophosphomannose synthase [Pseudonocardia sp.]|jgi:dolichol-phosphate mannosyltransferase